MKMQGSIRNIAIYHPDKLVENEFYFNHFEQQGKDVRKLFEKVYGRNKRYVIDQDAVPMENTLTMQVNAAKSVLEQSGLKGTDMDMIIVATQVPEFVVPACAVLVHRAIEGKREAFCLDLNANCTSMLSALETAYRYLYTKQNLHKILIVGGEFASQEHNPNNELGYGIFGDAACALILEKTDSEAGLVDTDCFINDEYCKQMLFPRCGMSKVSVSNREEIYSTFGNVDCDLDIVTEKIDDILKNNNLGVQDISQFCFSQLLIKNIDILRENLKIPESKSCYVGDIYGYTGSTSPFLALYEVIQQDKLKRGDYILFWTIGAGMQHLILLIQY